MNEYLAYVQQHLAWIIALVALAVATTSFVLAYRRGQWEVYRSATCLNHFAPKGKL